MATNVNFTDVQSREHQRNLVLKAESNGATKVSSFTILPAGLTLKCQPVMLNGKLRLAVGTFTTSTDRVMQGCYFSGVDEIEGKKYFNFFVGMNDAELDDLCKPANSKLDYQIVTTEYTNSEGQKRVITKFESVYA